MSRGYGAGRSPLANPVVGVVVAAAVVFAFFYFQVPDRVGGLGTKALTGQLTPPHPIGQRLTVQGTGYRPSVDLTARAPVRTRSLVKGVRVRPGDVLLAVPLTARNSGDRDWDTSHTTTVTLVDSAGKRYVADGRFTRVRGGPVFPSVSALTPGRTLRNLAVVEVPRGVRLTRLEIKVGPGFSRLARWKLLPAVPS